MKTAGMVHYKLPIEQYFLNVLCDKHYFKMESLAQCGCKGRRVRFLEKKKTHQPVPKINFSARNQPLTDELQCTCACTMYICMYDMHACRSIQVCVLL